MEEQDADAAMREMMGFGSFGSNKRQKLNPGSGSRPPKPPTTSSNSTPLGKPRQKTAHAPKDSSLSTIPSTLPPSGRSQPSLPILNAAKLPIAATMPNVAEISEKDQTSTNIVQPIPPIQTQSTTETQSLTSQPSNPSLNATAQTFAPSQPTKSSFSASDNRSDPAYWSSTTAKQSHDIDIGYTSPWTGATLTRKELSEYGRGKREAQDDGTMVSVFFKPGFLATEEDLWGRWERGAEVA